MQELLSIHVLHEVLKPNWAAFADVVPAACEKTKGFSCKVGTKQMALSSDFRLTALMREGLCRDQGGKKV